jgi:5'-AMP-activated protein kinase catalytic alpha subunit
MDTQNLYKKIMAGEYTIPKFVSGEARDLIRKILNIDPLKRYRLPDIRRHPWFQIYKPKLEPFGLLVAEQLIPVLPSA